MVASNITVWTPVFNDEKLLRNCMDSVISQTVRPLEYLVFDDASKDSSLAVARAYAEKHPWIHVFPNEKNGGAIANFNRMLDHAKGEYIYCVASDDTSYPETLGLLSEVIERWPEASLVSGEMTVRSPEGLILGTEKVQAWEKIAFHPPRECLEEYFLKEPANHSVSAATALRKSSVLSAGRYRSELGHWSDSFVNRYIALKEGMVYIPRPLHNWTTMPGSLSGSQLTNPWKSLDIISRAAYLMRSDQFRDIFPEEFVRYFEKDYRDYIINPIIDGYVFKLQQRNQQFFDIISGKSASDRFLGKLFTLFLKLEDQFFTRRIRKYSKDLRNYSGDISCYSHKAEKKCAGS